MEKRISFFEYQNAVSVARIIDPYLRQKEEAETQKAKLEEELSKITAKLETVQEAINKNQKEIDSYEEGIVRIIGFHVTDLVKKVMVPTGKTTPAGKPAMTAEFVPTEIVTHDEANKQYIITIPEESEVPPTTENAAGSNFDGDKENLFAHTEETMFNK